ncbi:MAG: hypothetical protein A3F83_15415 [Candidatus Glassbacteria bacterium RIFCSPLOWO2_12_FULL_58_11]|uniref:Histidine kinase/HSP90-like ATPase domain-containing protein n=1 Tax=Candidatus Glassbacteria bacterium RIFCSPLOWO2_12_FULL_58_11 TaxID=1817867 RepID=A0A1F5YZ41_9BACT|nr:MAG: hypothetical protein A3F83_15415 [Candidatus Glassbacteria bacterium RIFCSPLOWO2_12_FULL_58_11]
MLESLTFDRIDSMIVPMEPDQELQVVERAENLALELGFGRDQIDEIKLALIEAVINAIEHGRSVERMVHISFALRKKPLCMAIAIGDLGAGFDPAAVQNPDIREKIGKKVRKRGWGLKIMRSLMDEVNIETSEKGTRITLVKRG